MENCISLKVANGNSICTATKYEKCNGKKCPFYRTQEEQETSLKKAYARLRTLDEFSQVIIADTYYCGEMPWKNANI